jgi:hypothetical protein
MNTEVLPMLVEARNGPKSVYPDWNLVESKEF